MILETTETRWFWVTDNLPGLITWFAGKTLDFSEVAEVRTDEYLVLPGCRTTAIKIRQGYLDVKALVANEGTYEFRDGLTGRIQRWVKWTLEDPPVWRSSGPKTPEWQKVTKARLLYQCSGDGDPVRLISGHSTFNANGHIELTKVSLSSCPKIWVTLCIEIFGTETGRTDILRKTAQNFFQKCPCVPNELQHAASLSYPEWLAS